jgi:hypothetical protein
MGHATGLTDTTFARKERIDATLSTTVNMPRGMLRMNVS